MKILLVCPPDIHADGFDLDTARRRRYLNFPPYGLGLVAAAAERDGHECEIVNLQTAVLAAAQTGVAFDFDAAWKAALRGRRPDLIMLTCMFSQTHKALQAASEYLADTYPSVKQIAGGVHVTNALAQKETRQKFIADLPHVSEFKTGEYKAAEHDTPAWHLMDPRESSAVGKVGSFYFLRGDPVTATILSNRGCRAHCTFCSVRNFNGEGVRRRDAAAVVDELLLLQNEYGVEHVMWLDDDLLFDRRATLALFDLMVKRGVKMTWDCTNGVIAKSCTEDVLSAAAASGCIGLNIGMESGSPEILRQVKKPGTVRIFIEAAKTLQKFESINARVFLMIGFPGETLRQMKQTQDIALEMNLDWHNITILQALPNTPMFEQKAWDEDFTAIRYNSGAYGHKLRREAEFSFDDDDLDRVPSQEELGPIWECMNRRLNFERLESEMRPVKLRLQKMYLDRICNTIDPGNVQAARYAEMVAERLGSLA